MTTSHVLLILIDHDADLIAAICGETMMLDFGKRLAMGPTRAVLDDPLHAHRQKASSHPSRPRFAIGKPLAPAI